MLLHNKPGVCRNLQSTEWMCWWLESKQKNLKIKGEADGWFLHDNMIKRSDSAEKLD